MYSIEYIVIRNSNVENVPENSKMRGKPSKDFNSNVMFISEVIIFRNDNVAY